MSPFRQRPERPPKLACLPPLPPPPPAALPTPNPSRAAIRADNATVEQATPPAAADTEVAGNAVSQACDAAASATPGPFVVYIQIHDQSQRALASRPMTQLGTFGLGTPGIENVAATARRNGRRQPASWPHPVLPYNAANDPAQACATALAGWLGTQSGFLQATPTPLPLPTRLHGDPKVIEFWMPAAVR